MRPPCDQFEVSFAHHTMVMSLTFVKTTFGAHLLIHYIAEELVHYEFDMKRALYRH